MSDDVTEVRVALVLNGGVSLAVWMSGVVTEIDLICRASRGEPPPPGTTSQEQQHHAMWQQITGPLRRRIVVDIIAGTSAGGLNGTILGTALACRKPLPDLKCMWDASARLTPQALLWDPGPTTVPSILDGDFFETKVGEVLRPLAAEPPTAVAAEAPDAEPRPSEAASDVTLFVTATALGRADLTYADAAGERFDVADHRRLYCFRTAPVTTFHPTTRTFTQEPRNDFTTFTEALVRGARASASYPAAFAPVVELPELRGLRYPPEPPATTDPVEPTPPVYLIDGGILDNAPLEPVIEEIGLRVPDRMFERVLAYVVPSNGVVARVSASEAGGAGAAPNWVSILGSALDFPRESDFRHDVARLWEALGADRTRTETSVALLRDAALDPARRAALVAAAAPLLAPYRASRIVGSLREVRDGLAARRTAVPSLRPATDTDLGLVATPASWVPDPDAEPAELAAETWPFGFSGALRTVRLLMRETRERIATKDGLAPLAVELNSVRERISAANTAVMERVYRAMESSDPTAPPADSTLVALLNEVFAATGSVAVLTKLMGEAVDAYAASVDLDPAELRQTLAAVEVVTGAASGDSEAEDPPPFEFVRLGPDVASALYPDMQDVGGAKLWGTTVGHFGAFGKPEWRSCDYTWGRLDAAAHVAKYLGLPETQRVALEEQVLAAEGWRDRDDFQAKFPDADQSLKKTLNLLRSDPDGQTELDGVADSVLRFLAQPDTRVTLAGTLLRTCLGRRQRPAPRWWPMVAWFAGVTVARRKFWSWLRTPQPPSE